MRRSGELFEGLPTVQPDAALSLKTNVHDWYKDAVVYHLWLRHFVTLTTMALGIEGSYPGIGNTEGAGRQLPVALAVLQELEQRAKTCMVMTWSITTASILAGHQ